jgi:hypothetical protein
MSPFWASNTPIMDEVKENDIGFKMNNIRIRMVVGRYSNGNPSLQSKETYYVNQIA